MQHLPSLVCGHHQELLPDHHEIGIIIFFQLRYKGGYFNGLPPHFLLELHFVATEGLVMDMS